MALLDQCSSQPHSTLTSRIVVEGAGRSPWRWARVSASSTQLTHCLPTISPGMRIPRLPMYMVRAVHSE
eukprot:1422345-Amphidinium_carterae.1